MDGVLQQPEFTPPSLHPKPKEPIDGHRTPQGKHSWLEREELFLRVMVKMCVGPVVAIAPWSPALWDRNPLLYIFPLVAHIAVNGAVRGAVTGCGLLTLWFALRETQQGHHRENGSK